MRKFIFTILVCVLLLSDYTSRVNDLQPSDSQTCSLPTSSSPSSAPSVSASEPPVQSSTPSASLSEAPASSTTLPVQPHIARNGKLQMNLRHLPPNATAGGLKEMAAETIGLRADASNVIIVLRMTKVKISDLPLSVPYKIRNTSSKVVTVEPHYEMERYNGAKWISFPFNADDPPNWPEGNIQLEPGASIDDSLTVWNFAKEITPGTYRVVKEMAEDDKPSIMLYAEFVVVE